MERTSDAKRKSVSDGEIREVLDQFENDNDEVSDIFSSDDDEFIENDENCDDISELIDLEDERDPDFDPENASSSGSEIDGHDFDLDEEEGSLTAHIHNTEARDQVESSSAESSGKKRKKSSGKKGSGQTRKKPKLNHPTRAARKRDSNASESNEAGRSQSKKRKLKGNEILNDEDFVIKFDGPVVSGKQRKDGSTFIWKTQPIPPSEKTKGPKRNVHMQPGPTGRARQVLQPIDCFSLFINPEMLEMVLKHSNEEIRRSQPENATQTTREIEDMEEIKALIGLLIYGGAKKDNHLPTTMLFDVSHCGYWYRAAMSVKRFEFLLRALRFDDKETRRPGERFAPISELWNVFIENCKQWYKPGSYVTIDEQLVGFRGNCPFRVHLPNKPAKYGLKIIAMVDASSKYLLNAIPYTGKGSTPPNVPAAAYYVKKLVGTIENSNRNVTIDNCFTSIPLVSDLLTKGLTVVGTIRKDKVELPSSFMSLKFRNRKRGSSLFMYHEDMIAVSYKARENKMVTLVSSMHDSPELHPFSKKPFIIHSYNATKGGVATLDQLCAHSSCNRKTKRWPVCFFYNMINVACVNAFVIYQHNFHRMHDAQDGSINALTRLQFMVKLHEQLTYQWKQTRLQSKNLNLDLKRNITESLKQTLPPRLQMEDCDQVQYAGEVVTEPSASGSNESASNPEIPLEQKKLKKAYKLGNCNFCASHLKKKAITSCAKCQRRICGGHIGNKFCNDCSI